MIKDGQPLVRGRTKGSHTERKCLLNAAPEG